MSLALYPGLRRIALAPVQLREPASVLDQVGVQPGSRRRRVRLQLDGGRAPFSAVERRVFDPLPQFPVAAKEATNCQAEGAGLGVEEPGALAARAAVAV